MIPGGKTITILCTAEMYGWIEAEAFKHKVGRATIVKAVIVDAMEETNGLQCCAPPRRKGSGKGSEANGVTTP